MEEHSETLVRIHQAAMEEFLEKGFADASLRQIVKNAGVTTGPFMDTTPARRPCSPLWWSLTRRQ